MTRVGINRRSFIGAIGVMAGSTAIGRTAPSPNEQVGIAVLGCGRGSSLASWFSRLSDSRVVAICDPDQNRARALCAKVEDVSGKRPEAIVDFRHLLERKDIDGLAVATPDHWHAPVTIHACLAGKDVYVEKPVSHNVWEGRQLVNAARKYKKIVQTGTQARSARCLQDAVAYVKSGALGKIKASRGLCYKRRPSIGFTTEDNPIPESLDYNLWLGPAPKKPLTRKRLHYDWHWMWDYGNGDLGNQGIHQMDIARWFLGDMELSPRVWSVGGRLGYEDAVSYTHLRAHETLR